MYELRKLNKPHRGQMFRELRHRSGLSLQALGALICADPSTISRWETRKDFIQFARFVKALHRLGTTPELFLGLEAPEEAADPAEIVAEFEPEAVGSSN